MATINNINLATLSFDEIRKLLSSEEFVSFFLLKKLKKFTVFSSSITAFRMLKLMQKICLIKEILPKKKTIL